MRRLLYVVLPIFTLLLIAYSCKKDKGSPSQSTQNVTPPAAMTATISGAIFSANSTSARFSSLGGLTFAGYAPDGSSIKFSIGNFSGTGDYACGNTLDNSIVYTKQVNGQTFSYSTQENTGAGTISITGYDANKNLLSGFFTLVAFQSGNTSNSIEITDGKFSNLRIATLATPSNGELTMGLNGSFGTTGLVSARKLEGYDMELTAHEGTAKMVLHVIQYNGKGQFDGKIIYNPDTTQYLINYYHNVSVNITAAANATISGTFKETQDADFQGAFTSIPISEASNNPVDSGKVYMYKPGETPVLYTIEENTIEACANRLLIKLKGTNSPALISLLDIYGPAINGPGVSDLTLTFRPDSSNYGNSTNVDTKITVTRVDPNSETLNFSIYPDDLSFVLSGMTHYVNDKSYSAQFVDFVKNGNTPVTVSSFLYQPNPFGDNTRIEFSFYACSESDFNLVIPKNIAPGTYDISGSSGGSGINLYGGSEQTNSITIEQNDPANHIFYAHFSGQLHPYANNPDSFTAHIHADNY